MWMSVPQIADLRTWMSTSFGPTSGGGISCSHRPASRSALTRAFISDDSEGAADLDEGGDGLIDVLRLVRGGHLRADARLALRHDRVAEPDDVDAFLQHALGELPGELRVAEHDGDDRVAGAGELEA